MHPRGSDPYRWNFLPQKQHLFHKNLSKLSTNTYSQIIDGIGTFLEATPAKVDGGLCEDESITTGEEPLLAKLTAEIEQIRSHWHVYADNKLQTQNELAAKLEQAQTQIQALQNENEELKISFQSILSMKNLLKARLMLLSKAFNKVMYCTRRFGEMTQQPLSQELNWLYYSLNMDGKYMYYLTFAYLPYLLT